MRVGRADDRGPDPGARAGEGRVPAGPGRGAEGEPRRAGAAEHLHDERREPGPGRGARGRDRVPADARLRRGRGAPALPARGGPALRPGLGARRRSRRPRLVAGHRPAVPDASRDHAARAAPGRGADATRCAIEVELDAGFPVASGRQPLPRDRDRGAGTRAATACACGTTLGAGRPRLRARLDAAAGDHAARRPLRRGARGLHLRARHALPAGRAPRSRRVAPAARGRLRDRHLRLDGRALSIQQARQALAPRDRPAPLRRPLQRDPVQLVDRSALRRATAGDGGEPGEGPALGRGPAAPTAGRRWRPRSRPRSRAATTRRSRAPGRVPDRRQRRQRGGALRDHPRAARRHAAVHGRHRLRPERPLHDARRPSSGTARSPTSATSGRSRRRWAGSSRCSRAPS